MAYKTVQLFDKDGNKCFSNKGPAGRILVDHDGYAVSWFKVATITCTEINQDIYCRIKVVIPFNQNCSGILIAHIRVNGEKKIESCDTYWESKTLWYFSPRNVAISFDSSTNYIDLYFKPISQHCTIYYEVEDCLCRNGDNSSQNYTNISINSYANVNGITSLPNSVIYSVYLHKVGDIYISTSSTNPQDLFGGTWTQIQGRFLLGTGTCTDIRNDTRTINVGQTGGEWAHVLSVAELASHTHDTSNGRNIGTLKFLSDPGGDWKSPMGSNNADFGLHDAGKLANTGGNNAHNNIPPYYGVNIWRRTG